MKARHFADAPGYRVVARAFSVASESEELCQPVHLLGALEEVEGLSSALRPPGELWPSCSGARTTCPFGA